MIEVILRKFGNSLSEIYQQVNMQFAFMSKTNEQACEFVKCRDFLHDAGRTAVTGITSNIFGFSYNSKMPQLDFSKMKMLIRYTPSKDVNVEDHLKMSLKLVNHFERKAKLGTLSKLHKCVIMNNKKDVWAHTTDIWAFIGPSMWMSAPQLISMYTLLLRLGSKKDFLKFKTEKELKDCLKTISEISVGADNDSRYLVNCWDKLHTVIKERKALFPESIFNDYKNTQIGTFHDNCGIYKLCSFHTPNVDDGKYNSAKTLKQLLAEE